MEKLLKYNQRIWQKQLKNKTHYFIKEYKNPIEINLLDFLI